MENKYVSVKKFAIDNGFEPKQCFIVDKDHTLIRQIKKRESKIFNVVYEDDFEELRNKLIEYNKLDRSEKLKLGLIYKYGSLENYYSMRLEKTKKSCLEKFGVEYASQNEEIIKKINDTAIKNYGEDWRSKSSIKSQETKLKKYGKKSTTDSKKFMETRIKKYGSSVIRHIYNYNDIYFDSSWEIYFYIYHHDILKDNIKRGPIFEYYLNDKQRYYECDFEIDGKYYEVKGPQYLRDGQLYFPYSENKEYQQEVWNAKNECMKSNNVQIISDIEHIKKLVEEMYTEDFVDLFRIDVPFPYPTEIRTQLDICRVFHKSLYEATRLNKPSPYEAWFDKNLVYKCAMNRLKYVHSCTPNDIIKGFQISMIAPKVSIFKPTLAERLIKTYLNDYDNIYDPFSGFSGRLIGTNNCNKYYYGSDINKDHVNESNEIIKYLKCEKFCEVVEQDLLTDKIHYIHSNSCLFTCPPYGGKEHWNKNNNEVEKSCDEWIDVCMDKYRCDKYLFVVDKTEKYKDYIVETISNKSHFGENKEYVVLINK